MDTPADNPKKKKDQRPTLTFKGDEFGPEFRALINKAAEKAGMNQAQFVAETLRREAQRIIKGIPLDTPSDTPVSVPALSTERLDQQDKRIAELADAIRALTEMQKQTLWSRLLRVIGGKSAGVQAGEAGKPGGETPGVIPGASVA